MYSYALPAAGTLAVAFALLTPFQKSLYSSALCLLGSLMSAAALYFLLGCPLLGWMQVLVYAGAVMVLVVVSVMTSPARPGSRWASWDLPRWLIWALLVLPLPALGISAAIGGAPQPAFAGLEKRMAALLFGDLAVMTEAVGLLILISSLAVLPAGRGKP